MSKSAWIVVLAMVAAAIAAPVYWPMLPAKAADPGTKVALQTGVVCTVFLRGDAAGQAVQSYVASVKNSASVEGRLVWVDDQWVVLDREGKQAFIARQSVLMIEAKGK